MEIDGGGCNVTRTKTLQNVHQEEHGGEAQQNALTKQTDTMQHPPSSGTPSSDYQSTSQSARNSTSSADSAVGRSSSQLSCSDELESLTAQCFPVHESGHVPSTDTDASNLKTLVMEMRKIEASLGKAVKELTDQVGNFKLEIRRLQSEVSSLKGSSVETSESTPNQSSCTHTSPCPDSPETEPTPDVSTVDSQSQLYTRTIKNERLDSDSKIIRHRQSEIKRKQVEFAKKRPHSIHVSSDVHETTHVLVNKYLVLVSRLFHIMLALF